jgi:hypothetical protein
VPGKGIRVEGIAGKELVDDGACSVDRGLTDELRHVEREPAAVAGGEGAEGHQVGGLLRLGGLAARHADDEPATVTVDQQGGVEPPVRAGAAGPVTVPLGLRDVEVRNSRGGQRG